MELHVLEPETKTPKFEDDPLISFIVPVHAKNLDKNVFKRCLMSLDNQDYENREIVIVLNGGEDEKLQGVAQFYANKDSRFRLIKIAEGGACHARNVGFEASNGEIVSFFNSDYKLKTGMARLWVDALVNNPDCGFAYGGYEYATAPAYHYGSRPFDPFLLTQFNYIDCGFPLWRKYAVKWDSDVKSLQDWDFWLRVVRGDGNRNCGYDPLGNHVHDANCDAKVKVKGHFLGRDLTFIAEPPRPKGLSDDSSQNWIDRVKFVRAKNGIPTSDLVVTSIGAEFHGVRIAQMLGADFRDLSVIQKPNEYKALYMIGWYMRPDVPHNDHPTVMACFPKEVKKIIHFVGADIYWLRKFPYESMKVLAGVLKMGTDHILCENEAARAELAGFGIDASVVPIPPYNDYELRPLPETYKVALYLTDKSDFDKYLQTHTLSIVRAMPDVEFSGYGDGAKDFKAPNFTHYGNMDSARYKEFVYEQSCVLRLVKHDTLPMAACDMFLAGRHVVSNIDMPFASLVDTKGTDPINDWDVYGPGFSDVRWPATKKQIVQRIRGLKRCGKLTTKEARDYWADVLDRQKYVDTIRRLTRA